MLSLQQKCNHDGSLTMVRTQIQLTEEQAAKLKKMAAIKGVSIAELIWHGVEVLLHSHGTVTPEERRHRGIGVAGRFHSGRSNLSSKHEEHLAEAYKK